MSRSLFLTSLCLLTLLSGPAAAETKVAQKILRGAANILSAPLEIPRQTRAYWIEGSRYTKHISFWIFSGAVKGVVNTVARAGSGVWDILTCVRDTPAVMQPEYVLQEWPQRPPPDNNLPAQPANR